MDTIEPANKVSPSLDGSSGVRGQAKTSPLAPIAVVATHRQPPTATATVLEFVEAPDGPCAASFRVLRYRLKSIGNPRAVAVASPHPQEGKTTCAVNLAMALAEEGRDTILLVDANLRSPRIAEVLGFAPPRCLSQQLARHLEHPGEPWQVVAAFFDNLHVLAVGTTDRGSSILNARALTLAMFQWKAAGYSHIIIDCPSIIGKADVNIIADMSDGVLMTAMARRTRASSLAQAKAHLGTTQILGTVLMGCSQ